MKKLLILMLVLGIASAANAVVVDPFYLTIDIEEAASEITLLPSDYITLDISLRGDGTYEETGSLEFAGGDIAVSLSNAQGALDYSCITFIGAPLTRDWYRGVWDPYAAGWEAPWGVITAVSNAQYVLMSGGNIYQNTMGPYQLMDDLVFHCEESTDVIIDLVAASDLIYYTYTYTDVGAGLEPVVDSSVVIATSGTILDSIYVHQIPEPMTIALLGMGSLFLLRRRK